MLERQPADLPELQGDLLLALRRQLAPPAADGQGLVDVAVDEGPADPLERRRRVPVHHIDPLGPVVAEQRRPLIRALPTSDHRDPGAGEVVEGHPFAGVAALPRRHGVRPLGEVEEVGDPWHRQHIVGRDRRAVLHGGDEAAVATVERGDQPLVDVQRLVLGEPVGVVEERRDRDRVQLRGAQAAVLDVRRERVFTAGVEVPVGARAQEHVCRHLVAPERHRDPDDVGVDAVVAGVRCRGVGVGTRTDDEQVGADHGPSVGPVRPSVQRPDRGAACPFVSCRVPERTGGPRSA